MQQAHLRAAAALLLLLCVAGMQRKAPPNGVLAPESSDGAAAAADEPALPNGVEFLFMRHGESAWNSVEHAFKAAKKECFPVVPAEMTDIKKACSDHNVGVLAKALAPEEAATALEERVSAGKLEAELVARLLKTAKAALSQRQAFDAPLNADGLEGAVAANKALSEVQRKWLQEHEEGQVPAMLVSSNLIRAVDTLLHGFADMVDAKKMGAEEAEDAAALDVLLVSSLQEFSQSGNGDPVAVFLPILLNMKEDAEGVEAWAKVRALRAQGHEAADLAPRDVGFFLRAAASSRLWTMSAPARSDLVNHDLYLPNSDLGVDNNVRREPLEDDESVLATVRLPGEYEPRVAGEERFKHFRSQVLVGQAASKGVRRFVVTGHSNWYNLFVAWLDETYGVHPSCVPFGASKAKLKNEALVRMTMAGCECVFDGTRAAVEGDEEPLDCLQS